MKNFFCKYKHLVLLLISSVLCAVVVFCCAVKSHAYSASDAFNSFVNNVFPTSGLFWSTAEQCVKNTSPVRISNKDRMEHLFDDELPIEYYLNGSGTGTESDPVVKNTGTTTTRQIVNNLDNSTYNYYTDQSETINNAYYYTSNTYDYYICDTDNYYISYSFEYNYYDIVVADKVDMTYHYFKQYYQLPDGRNSFNLSENDINGVIFCYNTLSYTKTATDPNVTALYHLDGSFVDVANNSSSQTYSQTGGFNSNGRFDGCYQISDCYVNDNVSLYTSISSSNSYNIKFWFYNYGIDAQQLFTTNKGTVVKGYSISNNLPSNQWSYIEVDYDGTTLRNRINGRGWDTNMSGLNWIFNDSMHQSTSYPSSLSTTYVINGVEQSTVSVQCKPAIINLSSNWLQIYSGPKAASLSSSNTYCQTITMGGYTYPTVLGLGCCIDELKITSTSLFSESSNAAIRYEPWDLTYAYTVPSNPSSCDIAIQSPVTMGTVQIGGVRPSNPSTGYVFIALYGDTCSSIQEYYDGIWNDVQGAIYYNGIWNNLYSWDFTNQMLVSNDDSANSGGYYYIDSSDNSSVTYIYNYSGSDVSGNTITISGNDTYDITVEQQTDDDGSKISWFLAIIGAFITWVGVCINALPLIPTTIKVLLSGFFLSIGALIIWKAVKR